MQNRREFLKLGVGGMLLAGAGVLNGAENVVNSAKKQTKKESKMLNLTPKARQNVSVMLG